MQNERGAQSDAETSEEESNDSGTKTGHDGQIEMTIAETPLHKASEEFVIARARTITAKDNENRAEKEWLKQMKEANKRSIKHKGDVIQVVLGRTIEDHAQFKKP